MNTTFRLSILLLVLATSPVWALKSRDLALSVDVGIASTGAGFRNTGGKFAGEDLFGEPTWFTGWGEDRFTWGYSGRVGVSYFANRFLSLDTGVEFAQAPFAFAFARNKASHDLVFRHDNFMLRYPLSITGYFLPYVVSTGMALDVSTSRRSTYSIGSTVVAAETTPSKVVPSFHLELGLAFDPSQDSRLIVSWRGEQQLGRPFETEFVFEDIHLMSMALHLRYLWKL